jgi:hypothetical protein
VQGGVARRARVVHDLAVALVTLVHEAEHVRGPYESEAVVECYAIEGGRELVLAAGSSSYANEIAGNGRPPRPPSEEQPLAVSLGC